MKINLDINRSEPILETINLRQGDGGLRTIDIQITDNNQPIAITGYTLQFEANLPNGLMTQHAGVIKDATAGLFSYTFTTADTSEAGQLPVAYFRLYDANNNSVATRNIRIVVGRSADVSKGQATEYLANVDKLVTDTSTKLVANNQQIAAQQTQLTALQAGISGLHFGVRNYLVGTSTFDGWNGWDDYNNWSTINNFGRRATIKFEVKSQNKQGIQTPTIPVDLILGNQYTLTFKARGKMQLLKTYFLNTSYPNYSANVPLTGLSETEFKEFSVDMEPPTLMTLPNRVAFLTDENPKIGDWFEILGQTVTLVDGQVAVTWSPAPEDYLNRIAALEQIVLNQ